MKFRSSILSLAAVSALTATAFMVTGCGSSSSSSGTTNNNNEDTSQNLTGKVVKGLWGGVPYELQRHLNNNTLKGFTTKEGGTFEYWSRDNVTVKGGLGLNFVFDGLNEADGSTVFVEDADRVTQGTTASTANTAELVEILAGIYQTLGINENGTGPDGKTAVTAADVNRVNKALTDVYESNTNKYKLLDNTDISSFPSELKDMYKALVGDIDAGTTGLLQDAGYTNMPNNNYTSLANSFAGNKTEAALERDKIVAEVAADAADLSGVTNADLKYSRLYVAYPSANNDTYMSFINMGSNVPGLNSQEGKWINGSIIQNITATAGAVDHRMIFTEPSFTEGNSVRFQNATAGGTTGDFANLTAGRFMFKTTPLIDNEKVDPTPLAVGTVNGFGDGTQPQTAAKPFNLTFGTTTLQFYPWMGSGTNNGNKSAVADGWYNNSRAYGFWNFTQIGGNSYTYAINMFGNVTTAFNTTGTYNLVLGENATDAMAYYPVGLDTEAANRGDSKNRTIIFKSGANINDKQFVGYYYEKLIDLLNISKGASTSDIGTSSSNVKSDMAIQYNK